MKASIHKTTRLARLPQVWRLAVMLLLMMLWLHLSCELWLGSMGLPALTRLHAEIQQTQVENQWLQERNQLLTAEILELKQGVDAIEERARHELGMIQTDETFVWIVAKDP